MGSRDLLLQAERNSELHRKRIATIRMSALNGSLSIVVSNRAEELREELARQVDGTLDGRPPAGGGSEG